MLILEPQSLQHPFKVLVIRAGALGDTAYASSIIEPLRHQYGNDVIIDWVAKSGVGKLFAQDSRIRRIFELKSRRSPLLFNKGKRQIITQSFREPYDLLVNLELGAIFDNTLRLTQAKQKIGSPYQHFKEPAETHAVENLHIIYRQFLNQDVMQYAYPNLQGVDPAKVKEKLEQK
ncbi:glycosyltransferase family 9 protein, partial [Kaarinaea lacus]